jgi:uncharacterized cupredoxin-like copper-binding protein
MRKLWLLALCFSAVALIIACGGSDDEDESSSASPSATTAASSTASGGGESEAGSATTTVQATLSEFTITLDKQSAESGKVTFDAKNSGAIAHELVVIRTDLAPDKLPVKDDGTVDESKVDVLGKTEQFDAGKTDTEEVTLPAGKYLLICNVAGHYQAGLHTAFTVN